MAKDFANRKTRTRARVPASRKPSSRTVAPRRTPPRGTTNRSGKPNTPRKKRAHRSVFHGPSFSGGMVLGALVVVTAAYLPELFRTKIEPTLAAKHLEAREPVTFEFAERLRNSQIHADPDTYAADAYMGENDNVKYVIQAASFRAMDDAESLRAQLLLIDLPAQTNRVQVGDKQWYRVKVGPFLSRLEAGRAMTRVRELDLDAILIKQGP